jgi:hypothetical protein
LENGAQFLSFDTTETIQYYGVANAKKQAKLISKLNSGLNQNLYN